jgi:hypothetical protein
MELVFRTIEIVLLCDGKMMINFITLTNLIFNSDLHLGKNRPSHESSKSTMHFDHCL